MRKLLSNQTFREAIVLVLIAVVVFVGLRLSIQSYIVYGPSMQPNFVENQRIIVNKLSYLFGEPHRGDVIVFKPPFNDMNYIKRVIGLPGESVEVKEGVTYVYKTDGTTIIIDPEPYVEFPSERTYSRRTIPEGEYYVMGDNRNNSSDSRSAVAWLSVLTFTIPAAAGWSQRKTLSAKRGSVSGPLVIGDSPPTTTSPHSFSRQSLNK